MCLAKKYMLSVPLALLFSQMLLGFSFPEAPRCDHRESFIDMSLDVSNEDVEGILKDPVAAEIRCETILRKIWEKQGGGEMPGIVIERISEYGKPAEYNFKRKTIIIDPKAYSLCVNMSRYGEDALAFLIAHEYVHAYQHQSLDYASPGFFVETKTLKDWAQGQKDRRRFMESQADIQGAILCYLCGYEVDNMIPDFVEDLYDTFELKEADPLYDSKNERMEIAYRAQESVDQYILQYDMANYLNILQHHDKDQVIYKYLIDNFRSAEFYNNLGLSYVGIALQEKLEVPFRHCPYPFMLDTETRLEQIGTKAKLPAIKLLEKSIENFDQAIALNADYLATRINRACTYHLLSSIETSQKSLYLQRAESDLTFVKRYKAGLFEGRPEELERLKNNAHQVSAIIAFPNMCKEKESRAYQPEAEINLQKFPWKVDGIDIREVAQNTGTLEYDWKSNLSFSDNISLSGLRLEHSYLLYYQNPSAFNSRFYLQKVFEPIPGLPKAIYQVGSAIPEAAQSQFRKSLPTLQGDIFLIHDKLGVVYRIGKNGKVKEWCRILG